MKVEAGKDSIMKSLWSVAAGAALAMTCAGCIYVNVPRIQQGEGPAGATTQATPGPEAGMTALHYAAINGHGDVAEMLLNRGANVNARAADGRTPLDMAAQNGHNGLLEMLLNRGAAINH